jgi:NAD-dependent deacetylase
MKNLVVLSGSGISAESGLLTFRDKGGLWEKYDFQKLASIEGWRENPQLVLEFYNARRDQVRKAEPNEAHFALAWLEEYFHVTIITQNVDNLHERAGSGKIVHLHGEIMKAKSSIDSTLIYELGDKNIYWGDKCAKGSQLRPFIVWFGEAVPMMSKAVEIVSEAEIFIIVGTSLQVYPAASLIHYVPSTAKKFIVDKTLPPLATYANLEMIEKPASTGIPSLVENLIKNYR